MVSKAINVTRRGRQIYKNWTLATLECYERKGICAGCFYSEYDCHLGVGVQLLLEKVGKPDIDTIKRSKVTSGKRVNKKFYTKEEYKQIVLETLKVGPMNGYEIGRRIGRSNTVVNEAARELRREGKVKLVGRSVSSKYYLVGGDVR